MLQQLLNIELQKYILIFLRIGSAIMLMPGFMTSYINIRYRLSIALALSIVLYPFLEDKLPTPSSDFLTTVKLYMFEITIGVFFGLMMQFAFTTLNLAGNFAGTAIGFSNSQLFDPSTQVQSIVLESFFSIVALCIIFVTDLHHTMLSAVISSYDLFPVTEDIMIGDMADYLSTALGESFITGFRLASPFIAFTVIFYTGMGLVSRLMPQLNIFFLSLPLQLYLGIGLLFITLPAIIFWFIEYYERTLQKFIS